jgi:hypothetical protein
VIHPAKEDTKSFDFVSKSYQKAFVEDTNYALRTGQVGIIFNVGGLVGRLVIGALVGFDVGALVGFNVGGLVGGFVGTGTGRQQRS